MALFSLSLPDGRGHVGGDADEYISAIHPADRHLVKRYRDTANTQDSFSAEYRVVQPDGSIVWLTGRGQVLTRTADGKAHRVVSIMADITERKKAEEHIQFLMREMAHRSKNLLMVIQAIANQTLQSAATTKDFESRFIPRLHGLAASYDLLIDRDWQGASLADLVRRQLAPFVGEESSRLHASGPEAVVTAQAAEAIGLALHELATNAVKYGALSAATGKVRVLWTLANETGKPRGLSLSWSEEGGPAVSPPPDKGFGFRVIERMVATSVNGDVSVDFAPEGFQWVLSIPAESLLSVDATDPAPG